MRLKPFLGQLLVNSKYLNKHQLNRVLREQINRDQKLGEIAVELNYLTSSQVEQVLKFQNNKIKLAYNIIKSVFEGLKRYRLILFNKTVSVDNNHIDKRFYLYDAFVKFPFEDSTMDESYSFLIEILKEIILFPCYYIYLIGESKERVMLEYMDNLFDKLDSNKIKLKDASLIEKLRNPDIQIPNMKHFESLSTIKLWDTEFLNIPLFDNHKSFFGIIIGGPCKQKIWSSFKMQQFANFSSVAGFGIKQIRKYAELNKKINSLKFQLNLGEKFSGPFRDLDSVISTLLYYALTTVETESGFIALKGKDGKSLVLCASRKIPDEMIKELNLKTDNNILDWRQKNKKDFSLKKAIVCKFTIKSHVVLPIMINNRLEGIFVAVDFNHDNFFTQFKLQLLNIFVDHASMLIQSSRYFNKISISYINTLVSLSDKYDSNSSYTIGQSKRISDLAVKIAIQLQLPEDQIYYIKIAGLISNMQNNLDYLSINHDTLKILPIMPEIIKAYESRQEWFDGWGYPKGLKGENIPLAARILGVADYFVKATSNNNYIHSLSWNELYKELNKRKGMQFDPKVVHALIDIILQKQNQSKFKPIEACWKFYCQPKNICDKCPSFKKNNIPCWINNDNLCYKHGTVSCRYCFIYLEWLERAAQKANMLKYNSNKSPNCQLIQIDNNISGIRLNGTVKIYDAPVLDHSFNDLINYRKQKIIIDLSEAKTISLYTLGIINIYLKEIETDGGRIVIINSNQELENILKRYGYSKKINIYKELQTGLIKLRHIN